MARIISIWSLALGLDANARGVIANARTKIAVIPITAMTRVHSFLFEFILWASPLVASNYAKSEKTYGVVDA